MHTELENAGASLESPEFRVFVLVDLLDGPSGGGNQFLKALRRQLEKRGFLAKAPEEADLILFNSFPFGDFRKILALYKFRRQGKLIVHRLDGPISVVRGRDRFVDILINKINFNFSDATVFQTEWSKSECLRLGLRNPDLSTVIPNGVDDSIFQKKQSYISDAEIKGGKKIKIVSTSWSANWRKGFDVLGFLDKHLDFSKFEFTFIGNSPISFQNIKHVQPMKSAELSKKLADADIFLAASINDPCSNALIEAKEVGLWILGRNSGGHPELIGDSGVLFSGTDDVIEKLNELANKVTNPPPFDPKGKISFSAQQYITFCRGVFSSRKRAAQGRYGVALLIYFLAVFWNVIVFFELMISKRWNRFRKRWSGI